MNIDRPLPPQSIESEMAVIGGIFIDNAMIDSVHGVLSDSDFYRESHRAIFQAMTRLHDRNEPIDLITISAELRNVSKLDEVGGGAYLAVLVDFVPMSANTLHYCRIVAEKAERRRLITNAQDAITIAYGESNLTEAVNKLEVAVSPAAERNVGFVTMSQSLRESIDRIQFRHQNRDKLTGLSYGLDDLDAKTFGMHGGELIIVAGRPSMGKSAFAGNIAKSVASEGKAVLMFTLEMPRADVTDRIIASYSLKYQNIRSGNMSDAELAKMGANILPKMSCMPLFIDDSPGVSLKDVRSKARRMKKQHDLKFLVVDYLQLMLMSNAKDSRILGLGEITRGLKLLARELEIPVMLLSQLNRSVDSRTDKRPMMSDLRDSGEIEQDADVILFPFRPAAYCDKCRDRVNSHDHNYEEHQSEAEIIIEKQRAGERNLSIKTIWLGEYQRFENAYHGGGAPIMRAMLRTDDKWTKASPDILSSWLWQHDGDEAVVIDDASQTYYCGRPEMVQQYREAWAKERKVGDKRQAAMFHDLDRQLFAKETPIMPDCSPAWCAAEGCFCSEIFSCTGECL